MRLNCSHFFQLLMTTELSCKLSNRETKRSVSCHGKVCVSYLYYNIIPMWSFPLFPYPLFRRQAVSTGGACPLQRDPLESLASLLSSHLAQRPHLSSSHHRRIPARPPSNFVLLAASTSADSSSPSFLDPWRRLPSSAVMGREGQWSCSY
jgi:hypothetical protein